MVPKALKTTPQERPNDPSLAPKPLTEKMKHPFPTTILTWCCPLAPSFALSTRSSQAGLGWWDSRQRIRRPRLRGWRARPALQFSPISYQFRSPCSDFLLRSSCPGSSPHLRVFPAAPASHQPTPKLRAVKFRKPLFSPSKNSFDF